MRIVAAQFLVCTSFGIGWLIGTVTAPSLAFDASTALDSEDGFCRAANQIEFDFIPLEELEAAATVADDAGAQVAVAGRR